MNIRNEEDKKENETYEKLKEAIIEMRAMREGKLEKKNIKEVLEEFDEFKNR